MRVGHVCRHWREVALGCPALWSAPIFASPELAEEMLKRSKMATLTVNAFLSWRDWTAKNMDQLENTLVQSSRIRTLEIQIGTGYERLAKAITSFISPAPLLETVSFTIERSCALSTMTLPIEAFEQATSLRSLELDRVGFTWQSGLFKHSGLTKLHLKLVPPSGFAQMLEILGNMPYLRILELLDSLPLDVSPGYEHRVLAFKDLQRLEVTSTAPSCATFLRYVQFPANTQVILLGKPTRSGDSDLGAYITIISVISRMMQRTTSGNTQKFHTFRSASLACDISDDTRLDMYEGKELKGDPLVTIWLNRVYLPQSASERLWRDIVTSFDFSDVQYLKLVRCSATPQTLKGTIAKYPKLNTLELCGSTMDVTPIFQAIQEDWDNPKTLNALAKDDNRYSMRRRKSDFVFPSPTFFTRLKTIKILGGDFSRSDWRFSFSLEFFVHILKQRCNMNAPIERLVMDQCENLQDWKLKLLVEVVPEVIVDGLKINYDELDGETEDTDNSDDEEKEESDDGYDTGGFSAGDLEWFENFS